MKTIFSTLTILSLISFCCSSQPKQKNAIEQEISKKLSRIDFYQLAFFGTEIVNICKDTVARNILAKSLKQSENVKQNTPSDRKEFELTMFLFYKAILDAKASDKYAQVSRADILKMFKAYSKLNFEVDEALILEQTDDSKRNMVNGYDEGTTAVSAFVFFSFYPLMYKHALLHNNRGDDWERMGLFICNMLRENENPKGMRVAIKEKLINNLNKNRAEFSNVVQKLLECDTAENLYD
jgi:hypothetical protein